MSSFKAPCVECREKHSKCSKEQPKCRRCRLRDLPCTPGERKEAFRQATSAALFTDSQVWVQSKARGFRQHTGSRSRAKRLSPGREAALDEAHEPTQLSPRPGFQILQDAPILDVVSPPSGGLANSTIGDNQSSDQSPPILGPATESSPQEPHSTPGQSNHPDTDESAFLEEETDFQTKILEACLIHYYIDELSHWVNVPHQILVEWPREAEPPQFDLCDPKCRFQLLVPERAQTYPPLLNAILAVSARHLCRLDRLRTAHGDIVYRGQHLGNLSPETGVEYMLKCLPALRAFHETTDDEVRVLMVTTAVILRQFEEMESDEGHGEAGSSSSSPGSRVSFLSIVNAALQIPRTASFLGLGLLSECYWVALRQEVYDALVKGYSPGMDRALRAHGHVSPANRAVLHASLVTRWMFEGKSKQGWDTLKEQEQVLETEVASQFQPLLYLPPDKERGQVFPTIWYRTATALTAQQHLMLAKMALLAESPLLEQSPDTRAAYRNAEAQVRAMVLEICGASLQHVDKTPPGIVNAAIAVHLYGHFFTDGFEREALKGVVRRFGEVRAWPMPRPLTEFLLS